MAEPILFFGDCRDAMKKLPDNTFDSIVTDPPYGLSKPPDMREVLLHWLADLEYEHDSKGFMNLEFDRFIPGPLIWKEVLRVAKPGATLLCFAGARTQDLMGLSLRLAGWEIIDTIMWLQFQGMATGADISKLIDKKFGAEREVLKEGSPPPENFKRGVLDNRGPNSFGNATITAPATDLAKSFVGFRSRVKSFYEPIIVAQKPLDGNYAENAIKWGVAGLNIDACRIAGHNPSVDRRESAKKSGIAPISERHIGSKSAEDANAKGKMAYRGSFEIYTEDRPSEQLGRFPCNVIISHTEDCKLLGYKKVESKSKATAGGHRKGSIYGNYEGYEEPIEIGYADKEGKELVEDWDCPEYCPVRQLDEHTGVLKSGDNCVRRKEGAFGAGSEKHGGLGKAGDVQTTYGDEGGASRFFYCPKTSPSERLLGCEDLFWKREGKVMVPCTEEEYKDTHESKRARGNIGPTVKPINLMEYLTKLVKTPTEGVCFDPFMGTGSTGVACLMNGMDFVGCEMDSNYFRIAETRINLIKELSELL